jgi:hypothetical protein
LPSRPVAPVTRYFMRGMVTRFERGESRVQRSEVERDRIWHRTTIIAN